MGPHVPGRGSANKPFITEYKLAFKDPTPFLRKGTQPINRKKALAEKQAQAKKLADAKAASAAAAALAVAEAKAIRRLAEKEPDRPKANPVQSKRKDIWGPPTNQAGDSTSLTLPAMLPPTSASNTFRRRRVLAAQNDSACRYNIISGHEIHGEAYSGYKEGRRAVIQTFSRIDLITNARTPGYNIISAKDYALEDAVRQQLNIV
ncbi:hypothetical protein HDU79_003982 [Rhizoclosmatium sp. JEL0117]|nr:hypothetical protein HDU79_003982 [Rhizoclosmatium sp. JEL0117]